MYASRCCRLMRRWLPSASALPTRDRLYDSVELCSSAKGHLHSIPYVRVPCIALAYTWHMASRHRTFKLPTSSSSSSIRILKARSRRM